MITSTRTLTFKFGEKHLNYMRRCRDCQINVAEGAVRAGKTVDNVFAFAYELEWTPDKLHIASGSTMGNAKLNIGDCNGYGLEGLFRGRCRWGKYKGNEALIVRTATGEKVVLFAGAELANSYKKIRGNSYGMWIATEINLHHDSFIEEAFNRQLAAKRIKVFWDLNPSNPRHEIYTKYIDNYDRKQKAGIFPAGYNYEHFTIFDNATLPPGRIDEIVSRYDSDSIWYIRDILGQRTIAEGLVYPKLATSIAAKDQKYIIPASEAMAMAKRSADDYGQDSAEVISEIYIGVDFGGNGSGHAFVASALTAGYEKLIVLRTVRYVEGERDPETGRRIEDIDPNMLCDLFLQFTAGIVNDYGFVTKVYVDSAESVLKRGIRHALEDANMDEIGVADARKSEIIGRIRAATFLAAQNRLLWTEECATFEDAVSTACWNPKKIALERLDDGTSDIDTLDAFEYTFERKIRRFQDAVLEVKSNGDW